MMTLTDDPLSELEQKYWDLFLALFMKVEPKHPEKGIKVMLKRARNYSEKHSLSLETALEKFYEEAKVRTEKRLALFNQCSLEKNKEEEP